MIEPRVITIRRTDLSGAGKAAREMEEYCMLHPRTPAAVRRPRISLRRGVWVALLGPSLEKGISGFGSNVATALAAFDRNYLAALQPPEV